MIFLLCFVNGFLALSFSLLYVNREFDTEDEPKSPHVGADLIFRTPLVLFSASHVFQKG